jgi:hypothetical protein
VYSSRRLAEWTGLARLTGVKSMPINVGLPWGVWPTGFLPFFPLPAKIVYKIGKPIDVPSDPALARDRRLVKQLYHEVIASMQTMVDELAARRRFPILG